MKCRDVLIIEKRSETEKAREMKVLTGPETPETISLGLGNLTHTVKRIKGSEESEFSRRKRKGGILMLCYQPGDCSATSLV